MDIMFDLNELSPLPVSDSSDIVRDELKNSTLSSQQNSIREALSILQNTQKTNTETIDYQLSNIRQREQTLTPLCLKS